MKFRFNFLLIILVHTFLLEINAELSFAQSPPTPPTVNCPSGTDPTVCAYITAKAAQAQAQQAAVAATILTKASGTQQRPHYKGNSIADVATTLVEDYFDNIWDSFPPWGGCMDWAMIGICRKKWSIKPYVEYYFPTEVYETADFFQGEYIPDLVISGMGDPKDYWYDNAETKAPKTIKYGMDKSGISGSEPAEQQTVAGLLPEQFREHNAPSGSRTHKEFRIMSTLAQMLKFLPMPAGPCHDGRNTGLTGNYVPIEISAMGGVISGLGDEFINTPIALPLMSEAPANIALTRLPSISNVFFPIEMNVLTQKLNKLPQDCIGNDISTGYALNSTFLNLVNVIPAPFVCTKYWGSDYPGTTYSNKPFSIASGQMMIRANRIFRAAHPSNVFSFAKFRIGKHYEDRFGWRSPSFMPSSCKQKVGEYGDFRDPNYKPQIDQSDPERYTMTHWSYLRCCPAGYKVFIMFPGQSGKRRQIKGDEVWPGVLSPSIF